jgi:hypothetical protein
MTALRPGFWDVVPAFTPAPIPCFRTGTTSPHSHRDEKGRQVAPSGPSSPCHPALRAHSDPHIIRLKRG